MTDTQIENGYEEISAALIEEVCARLAANKPVKRKLPGGGRLNIDRMLPFLCVYRRNPQRKDAGTERFVHPEAAFLNAPGDAPQRKGLKTLVQRIAQTAAEQLGGFLVLEIWSASDTDVTRASDPLTGESLLPAPRFRILTRVPQRPEGTCATLKYELQRIKLQRRSAASEIVLEAEIHPAGMSPLMSSAEALAMKCHVVGLEVLPIYRNGEDGDVLPGVLRVLRRGVGRALKKALFTFALSRTIVRPQHYFALGRKSLPKLVWDCDRQLAEVSSQFKFLLQVTPINAERSWYDFRDSGFRTSPRFEYRPLDADPLLLKRQLLQIATERVADPTLSYVLRQTQDELDRQITMLADLRTSRFLPGSIQVFGSVEADLLSLARQILTCSLPAREADGRETGNTETDSLDAHQFAELANEEIQYYRSQIPHFTAKAIVRDDIYSGLLCTGGNLLIGHEFTTPASRAAALVQHEVGTHLVTYYNGSQQPLSLLRVGLAGYDDLQEGLAVLAEFLVGGLSRSRLRVLAGRVMAVHSMVSGETFPVTFSRLVEDFAFEPRLAYTICLRVFRGGGLTKDAVYLRGLAEILRYLCKGGELTPLFVGKIADEHIPVIKELQHRNVLRSTPIVPRYVLDAAASERLVRLRDSNATVIELMGGGVS